MPRTQPTRCRTAGRERDLALRYTRAKLSKIEQTGDTNWSKHRLYPFWESVFLDVAT
jgi:hypothetical protein